MIIHGEGVWVYDQHGKSYLDGLSGLFTSQLGHGRMELVEAGAEQAAKLAYFPVWSYAHPKAVELAEKIAELTPGRPQPHLLHHGRLRGRRVGLEAGPPVLQADRPAPAHQGDQPEHRLPRRHHGRPVHHRRHRDPHPVRAAGARAPSRCPNTNFYRAPYFEDDEEAFGRWAADAIEQAIEAEGPETVAAVFLEPVQNAGGCFPPPPGYFQRVREICDRHGVLLVSDEVICAFGRLGHFFGAERYDYVPDIITMAKGLTSGLRAARRAGRQRPGHRAVPRPGRASCTASPSPATR